MIPGKLAGVITRPEDQIIGLGDDNEFFGWFSVSHQESIPKRAYVNIGKISPSV
jgi:hypothetical protein